MSWKPIPKVIGGTVAGAATVILLWLLGLAHVQVPDAVGAAIGVVLTSITAYLIPTTPQGGSDA